MTILLLLVLIAVVLFVVVGVILGVVFIVRSRTSGQQLSGPTPGWYPSPDNPAVLRWFDGRNWTQQTRAL